MFTNQKLQNHKCPGGCKLHQDMMPLQYQAALEGHHRMTLSCQSPHHNPTWTLASVKILMQRLQWPMNQQIAMVW